MFRPLGKGVYIHVWSPYLCANARLESSNGCKCGLNLFSRHTRLEFWYCNCINTDIRTDTDMGTYTDTKTR